MGGRYDLTDFILSVKLASIRLWLRVHEPTVHLSAMLAEEAVYRIVATL